MVMTRVTAKNLRKITDPLLEIDILKSKRKRRKKKRKTKEQRKEKGCALWGNSGRGVMPEKMLRTAKASWQGVFFKEPLLSAQVALSL